MKLEEQKGQEMIFLASKSMNYVPKSILKAGFIHGAFEFVLLIVLNLGTFFL